MWFLLHKSERFKNEITHWVEEGIIDRSQADTLFSKYELTSEKAWYTQSSYWIYGTAALLAAMSVFLIISSNWSNIPVFGQSVVVFLPFLIASFFSVYFFRKQNDELGEILLLLTSLFFGANIALQAQIFHISAYYPDGVLWWIIGVLPFIVFYQSKIGLYIYGGLFMIYLEMITSHSQISWMALGIFAALAFVQYKKPNILGIYLLGVILYMLGIHFQNGIFRQDFSSSFENNMLIFGGTIMILVYGFDYIQRDYKEAHRVFLNRFTQGIVLFLVYLCTFKWVSKEVCKVMKLDEISPIGYIFIGAGILLFILYKEKDLRTLVLFGMKLLLLSTFILNEDTYLLLLIISNVSILGFAGYLIYDALQTKVKSPFLLGLFLILALAISHYIELYGDYILTALLFLVCSAALALANRYWNKQIS